MPRDCFAHRLPGFGFGSDRMPPQCRVHISGLGQALDENSLVGRFDRVGRQAGPQRVAITDALSRQRKIHPETALEARQQMAAADVRKKADADLRHRELGVFGKHPVGSMKRQADTAAHDDTVDQRDIGLGKAGNARVQPVLVGKELDWGAAGLAAFIDSHYVAAGGKRPALALQQHQIYLRISLPGIQSAR